MDVLSVVAAVGGLGAEDGDRGICEVPIISADSEKARERDFSELRK